MRVVEGRDLDAVVGDEALRLEPTVLDGLLVELRSWVRRRERDLDRMRIDLAGEADRVLNGFLRLPGKPDDERSVNGDSELVAVLREAARHIHAGALPDVVQDLLTTRLVAHEEQAQAVFPQDLQRLVGHD